MTAVEQSADSAEPSADTTALVYSEIAAQLDKQFEQIGALNARAQQLLVFAAGVFALITAVRPPKAGWLPTILFCVALLLFVVVVVFGYAAWSIYGWRRDPHPAKLWQRYSHWPADWLRQQIILNMIVSHDHNARAINGKLYYVRATQVFLGAEVSYLIALLILRPYIK